MNWNKFFHKLLILIIGSFGLFGLALVTHIVWRCMREGGDDWELPIAWNRKGEGEFELIMITAFLILYIIGMGYLFLRSEDKKDIITKRAKKGAKKIFKELSEKSQQKYISLMSQLNEE